MLNLRLRCLYVPAIQIVDSRYFAHRELLYRGQPALKTTISRTENAVERQRAIVELDSIP